MKKEKVAISALAIAGILALGFGFWQLKNNIKAPFLLKPAQQKEFAEETIFDLQVKDTDKDGLSDYDEIYVYGTSPYIEDSDSDGITDEAEINAGTDPNCPTGKDCGSSTSGQKTSIGFDIPSSPIQEDPSSEAVDLTNLSLNDIRVMLINAGIDEETLSQLDDNALTEIYKKALETTQ